MAKDTSGIGLRHASGLEPGRHGMPQALVTEAVAFHVERNESLAEQLTEASTDFAALGLATLQSGEQESILRQCLPVVEQTGADQRAVHWNGPSTGVVLEVMGRVAVVDVEHDQIAAVRVARLNIFDGKLRNLF